MSTCAEVVIGQRQKQSELKPEIVCVSASK